MGCRHVKERRRKQTFQPKVRYGSLEKCGKCVNCLIAPVNLHYYLRYRLFVYFSERAQNEERQLVFWDSAIDMDDSMMSDTHSNDTSDRCSSENRDLNNLIVNYLPVHTTQEDLQEMFQAFGEIESCKLIRHKATGLSLGYGFVKYRRHDDAELAISRMNGLMLHGKTLRVAFARPPNDPIKTGNIYVSNLKNTITDAELLSLFSPFGKVLSVKLMHNDNTPMKTTAIGFVRFENQQDAQKAVDALNEHHPPMNPVPIHVSFAKQAVSSPVAVPPIPPYYPRFNPAFGKTPSGLGGRNIRFDPLSRGAIPRAPVPDVGYADGSLNEAACPPLFIYNLAPEVEELHLWRLFGPYGAIRNVNIIHDKVTNRKLGYAFITMSHVAEAKNAIYSLDQCIVEGKPISVSFKKPGHKKVAGVQY